LGHERAAITTEIDVLMPGSPKASHVPEDPGSGVRADLAPGQLFEISRPPARSRDDGDEIEEAEIRWPCKLNVLEG